MVQDEFKDIIINILCKHIIDQDNNIIKQMDKVYELEKELILIKEFVEIRNKAEAEEKAEREKERNAD